MIIRQILVTFSTKNIKMKEGQRFVVSASQADMGCALPASIGVSIANPNKTVIVVTGDGSFASNVQDDLKRMEWDSNRKLW